MTSEREAFEPFCIIYHACSAFFFLYMRKDEVMLACEMHTILTICKTMHAAVSYLIEMCMLELYKLGYDGKRGKRH